MPSNQCRVCSSPNRVYIERLKEAGRSYAEMVRMLKAEHGEVMYERSFTAHFRSHVNIEQAQYLTRLKEQLEHEMELAPPAIAPLYAVALRNLAGLEDTKPNQEHLIRALKAIHEITGMRLQQHMLVAFAKERGRLADRADPSRSLPAESDSAAEGERGAGVVRLSAVRDAE